MMKVLPYNTPNALLNRVKSVHNLFWASARGHNPAPLKQTFANDTISYYIVRPFISLSEKRWGISEVLNSKNHNAVIITKNTCYNDGVYSSNRSLPNYGFTITYYNQDGIRFAKKISKGEDTVYLQKRDESYCLYDRHGVNPKECSLEEFEEEIARHQNV